MMSHINMTVRPNTSGWMLANQNDSHMVTKFAWHPIRSKNGLIWLTWYTHIQYWERRYDGWYSFESLMKNTENYKLN